MTTSNRCSAPTTPIATKPCVVYAPVFCTLVCWSWTLSIARCRCGLVRVSIFNRKSRLVLQPNNAIENLEPLRYCNIVMGRTHNQYTYQVQNTGACATKGLVVIGVLGVEHRLMSSHLVFKSLEYWAVWGARGLSETGELRSGFPIA